MLFTQFILWIFSNNFTEHPIRNVLSSTILRLNEKQVLLELYNKWWKVDDNSCKSKSKDTGAPQLQLKNLEGIFVFLAGGLAISCLVVCLEILAYAVQRSREEKVSLVLTTMFLFIP